MLLATARLSWYRSTEIPSLRTFFRYVKNEFSTNAFLRKPKSVSKKVTWNNVKASLYCSTPVVKPSINPPSTIWSTNPPFPAKFNMYDMYSKARFLYVRRMPSSYTITSKVRAPEFVFNLINEPRFSTAIGLPWAVKSGLLTLRLGIA